MAFVRQLEPATVLQGTALTEALVSIGMRFSARKTRIAETNIEDALYFASLQGMDADDLRLLSVLTMWLEMHMEYVNVDRLTQLVTASPSKRVRAFWASVAQWHKTDSRLAALRSSAPRNRVHLLRTSSAFQLKRRGEDKRFAGTKLAVPDGTLRRRLSDVLSPQNLCQRHRGYYYYYRVLIGSSYRADMWAALDADPSLSAAQVARRAYGSYATGSRVKREHGVLMQNAGISPAKSA